mgnify:CR=1 FL=1
MFEDSINILHLTGDEENILEAETSEVKIPRTGIFICTKGWINLTIDDNSYHVTEDCMIVYFAYKKLRITKRSALLTGILLGADFETIQPLLYNATNFNAVFLIKSNPLIKLGQEDISRIMMYSKLIEDVVIKIKNTELKENSDTTSLTRKELFLQQRHMLGKSLLLEIISLFSDNNGMVQNMDNRKEDILKKFMTSLYKNFRTKHEVRFYAKEQCLTCRYFSSIIKERSGQTPVTWISTALLFEAKQQLQTSTKSIGEISEYLNFPNQSYFGKWFKNHTGISPLDFKNGKQETRHKTSELIKLIPDDKKYLISDIK